MFHFKTNCSGMFVDCFFFLDIMHIFVTIIKLKMVLYKGNIFYVDEKFKNGYVKKKGLKGPKREMCMEFVC